jgi:outer membrane lipoprotein SlyB
MFNRIVSCRLALALAMFAMLAACATTSPGSMAGSVEIRKGVIEQITDVEIASNHHTGVGAVVGGAVGLGIGSLVGGGSGRAVAEVLGAVGGAVVGNNIQKKNEKPVPGQQIIVRTSSGVLVAVTQAPTNLHVGQKVYLQGNGENARVTAQ